MDDQTTNLLLGLLTLIGVVMAFVTPKLSAGALIVFFALMAAVGFILAVASPSGDSGQTAVCLLLAVPGVVLALLGRDRLMRT